MAAISNAVPVYIRAPSGRTALYYHPSPATLKEPEERDKVQEMMQQMQKQIQQLQSQIEPRTSCQTPDILSVGDVVYRQGQLASVVAVDHSLSPPSYVVRMAQTGDEVNCEIGNLVIPNSLNVPSMPETSLPSFADIVQRQRLELEPPEDAQALLRDMHEELQDALPQMPPEGLPSAAEMGPDMRFEAGSGYYEQPWRSIQTIQTPEMNCLPQYQQQLQPYENVDSLSSLHLQGMEGDEDPKNHALQALTEALDRAEVEMLSGRQRHSDVSDAMQCGFECSDFSPRERQSSNFALKAATEALNRALDDKPKADCAKELDRSLLTALGLRQNPASKECGGHKARKQEQDFQSFRELKERKEQMHRDPEVFGFEEPSTLQESHQDVGSNALDGTVNAWSQLQAKSQALIEELEADEALEEAARDEVESRCGSERLGESSRLLEEDFLEMHSRGFINPFAAEPTVSGAQGFDGTPEASVLQRVPGESHGISHGSSLRRAKTESEATVSRLEESARLRMVDREVYQDRKPSAEAADKELRPPSLEGLSREEVRHDYLLDFVLQTDRLGPGRATAPDFARVSRKVPNNGGPTPERKFTPRRLMKAPRSRDHLVDFVLDGSTTSSFVDGSLSRTSSMKGRAMSTCYRDFPTRKVTPRRQGGKVQPTSHLPPLSKKKIYQWQ